MGRPAGDEVRRCAGAVVKGKPWKARKEEFDEVEAADVVGVVSRQGRQAPVAREGKGTHC